MRYPFKHWPFFSVLTYYFPILYVLSVGMEEGAFKGLSHNDTRFHGRTGTARIEGPGLRPTNHFSGRINSRMYCMCFVQPALL